MFEQVRYDGAQMASTTAPTFVVRAATPANLSGTNLSFGLLLVFILMLLSSFGILFPQFEAAHPVQIVAIGGLAILALEKLITGRSFVMVWPDSYLVLGLFVAASLSVLSAFWVQRAYEATMDLGRIVLIYFLMINTIHNMARLRKTALVMVAGGLFPAVGALNNVLHGNLIEGRANWIGVFANSNELAYCLVVLVPIAVVLAGQSGLLLKVLLWGTVGVFTAAIYFTYSRGGILGFLAVLAMLALRGRGVSAVFAVVLLVATLVFLNYYWARSDTLSDISNDFTFRQRVETIKAGVAMFRDHPILGVGINCSIVAYPLYASGDLNFRGALIIHNMLIQALSETGILGFVPFVLLFVFALHRSWRLAGSKGPELPRSLPQLAAGIAIALLGFMVCGLSGGVAFSWIPYLLLGLLSSTHAIHS